MQPVPMYYRNKIYEFLSKSPLGKFEGVPGICSFKPEQSAADQNTFPPPVSPSTTATERFWGGGGSYVSTLRLCLVLKCYSSCLIFSILQDIGANIPIHLRIKIMIVMSKVVIVPVYRSPLTF